MKKKISRTTFTEDRNDEIAKLYAEEFENLKKKFGADIVGRIGILGIMREVTENRKIKLYMTPEAAVQCLKESLKRNSKRKLISSNISHKRP